MRHWKIVHSCACDVSSVEVVLCIEVKPRRGRDEDAVTGRKRFNNTSASVEMERGRPLEVRQRIHGQIQCLRQRSTSSQSISIRFHACGNRFEPKWKILFKQKRTNYYSASAELSMHSPISYGRVVRLSV